MCTARVMKPIVRLAANRCVLLEPSVPLDADALCPCVQVGYIDDRYGPLCLAAVITLALSGIFIVSVIDFVQQLRSE